MVCRTQHITLLTRVTTIRTTKQFGLYLEVESYNGSSQAPVSLSILLRSQRPMETKKNLPEGNLPPRECQDHTSV